MRDLGRFAQGIQDLGPLPGEQLLLAAILTELAKAGDVFGGVTEARKGVGGKGGHGSRSSK